MRVDETLQATIREDAARALSEDVGDGDLTAALIPDSAVEIGRSVV